MWICNRCHAENKDGYTSCDQCGATRSAGRFGSAPTALNTRPPQVSAPGATAPLTRYQEPNPNQVRQMPPPPPAKCMQGFGKVVGWALLILLPVLTALLAWRQYDVLNGVLVPLLVENDAAEALKMGCYIGFAVIAVLLSMLPGMHTLLLCSKSPPKRKKKKKK